MRKLLVPKTVSFSTASKKGYQFHGTKAFVEKGTRLPKGLSGYEKARKLSEIAQKAQFYTKPLSKRAKVIAQILEKNGIRVEKEIQDLHNGRTLFEKEGFALNSEAGQNLFNKDRMDFVFKIEELVGKMHGLGISHNHLHAGNIAITEKGK